VVQVGGKRYLTAARSRSHAVKQATKHAIDSNQALGHVYQSREALRVQDRVGKKLPVKGNAGISFKWVDGQLVPVKAAPGSKAGTSKAGG